MGIIAEDDSDVAVIREITTRLIRPKSIGFKAFVSNGCGKLRRKCDSWAVNLVQRGCSYLVVVHDLDDYNELELRARLTQAIAPAGAKLGVVLIPKREIEAWLLYDGAAIALAFHEKAPLKVPGDPESLSDPKKKLQELVWKKYRKNYLNTLHNPLIARNLSIACLKRSRSFAPHPAFVTEVRKSL